MAKAVRKKKDIKDIEVTTENSEVLIVRTYDDIILKTRIKQGQRLKVSKERAEQLINAKVAKLICLKD